MAFPRVNFDARETEATKNKRSINSLIFATAPGDLKRPTSALWPCRIRLHAFEMLIFVNQLVQFVLQE